MNWRLNDEYNRRKKKNLRHKRVKMKVKIQIRRNIMQLKVDSEFKETNSTVSSGVDEKVYFVVCINTQM